MKIVAFMQNMWLKNPASFQRAMAGYEGDAERQEAYRRRIIRYALFAGCLSGRRLKDAFGEDLCDKIIWEESTREVADNPKTIFPADLTHIRKVINQEQPVAVVTFGGIASKAVHLVLTGMLLETPPVSIKHIASPHPAARQPTTLANVKAAGVELSQFLANPQPAAVEPSPWDL